jgi:translation elongation factor P/translation initiation factor 5A
VSRFKVGNLLANLYDEYKYRVVLEITEEFYIVTDPDDYKPFQLSKEYVEEEYRRLTKLERALK